MIKQPMYNIICPDNNNSEREYIICVLFSFMGANYSLCFDDKISEYRITFADKTLVIEDHFWNHFPEPLSYLKKENLPSSKLEHLHYQELSIPIIYGRAELLASETEIICGLDMFSSAFFMLTRWEELLLEHRNGRCDENELFAVINDIYKRPIVNEYCNLLSRLILDMGGKIELNNRKIEVLLTHDVDRCYLSSLPELITNISKMIFMDGNRRKAMLTLKRYIQYKLIGQNPFDTFDLLMNHSDLYGFKNSFFFKACSETDSGYTYSIENSFVTDSINKILRRGHIVGFHPSENSTYNGAQFTHELTRLRSISNNVIGGRSHGLLYGNDSHIFWEREGLVYDSGLGFQFRNGFRAGTCYPYNIFDVYRRKQLNLLQKPFMLMDSVWLRANVSPDDFLAEAISIVNTVSKYRGTICLNWHSNLINAIEMKPFKKTYFQIVDYIASIINKEPL